MGLAQDLLQQAEHLATYEGANPSEAALRRAISTAYYSLFHLLVGDAAQRWPGSPAARTGLERSFQHGLMKTISLQFHNPTWRDWHGILQTVPPALQNVARTFVNLQGERHSADYNNYQKWTAVEAQDLCAAARAAFADWERVRADPIAGDCLLAMLLGKRGA